MTVTYLQEDGAWGVGRRSDARRPTPDALSVGTLVSAHLEKSAVKRNRMRRRCREALRVSLLRPTPYAPPPTQLLLAPHSSSLTCDFAELTGDVERFLLHLQHHAS